MNIDNLTVGQYKELAVLFGENKNQNESPFKIGKAYMFRTVTHIHVGVVAEIHGELISTTQGAWVADTGRFNEFLSTGNAGEVEVFHGKSGVNVGALVDWAEWEHDLYKYSK